jgi:ABC-type uncharacterized transport system ATPase subunit
MQADISAEQLIFNVPDVDPERRRRLVELLCIDLSWHMHRVSDGQRRRVQICMGLLKPFKVLLLDEVCPCVQLLLLIAFKQPLISPVTAEATRAYAKSHNPSGSEEQA